MGKVVAIPGNQSPIFDNKDTSHSEFVIDENDYRVICEILIQSGTKISDIETKAKQMVETKDRDEERRVCKLQTIRKGSDFPLPPYDFWERGRLRNAVGKLQIVEITSLPSSIGKLTNLTHLDLSWSGVTSLPFSIGKLRNLKHLDLYHSMIKTIPSSIGQLLGLEIIDLAETYSLPGLPEEVGDLISLKTLNLHGSLATAFPDSISGLKNLKRLSFSQLQDIPDSIGDLIELTTLDLHGSDIRSIPPSIGQLKNLECLSLRSMTKISGKLPEELGDLTNLKILELAGCHNITSLPDSMKRLQCLMYLNLSWTGIFKSTDSYNLNEFLLQLTRDHPLLGAIMLNCCMIGSQVTYALACNRARSRTLYGVTSDDHEFVPMMPELWPLVLKHATRAFRRFSYRDLTAYPPQNYECTPYHIKPPDAIFQLLSDCRESFLVLLIHNHRNHL